MPSHPEDPSLKRLAMSSDVVQPELSAAEGPAGPTDGIPTGYPSIDRILGGGVRRGDLVVIGGDIGSGKSSLALAIALRMTEVGRTACFLSGEMTADRLVERALAIEGRVRIEDLRRDTLPEPGRSAVNEVVERLRDRSPVFDRLPRGGMAELPDALRRHLDLDIAVIDGLQDLAPAMPARAEGEAAAIRALKSIALDQNIAMIVTAHLPALSRDRQDLRPRLEDYGALGAVSQHADVVLGLFREEMYSTAPGVEGATELVVNKNRNGITGYVDLYFYKQWLRFEDMLDPDR